MTNVWSSRSPGRVGSDPNLCSRGGGAGGRTRAGGSPRRVSNRPVEAEVVVGGDAV